MYKKKKSTLLTQTRKPVKVELFFNIEENFKVWTIWKKQKKTQSTNNTIFNKLALNFRGKINKFYVYKYFIHVFRSFSRERENFVFLKNLGKIKKQKAYFIGYHEKIIKFKNFLPPKKKKHGWEKGREQNLFPDFLKNQRMSEYNWYKFKIYTSYSIFSKTKKEGKTSKVKKKFIAFFIQKKLYYKKKQFLFLNSFTNASIPGEKVKNISLDLQTLGFYKNLQNLDFTMNITKELYFKRKFIFLVQMSRLDRIERLQKFDFLLQKLKFEILPFQLFKYSQSIILENLLRLSILSVLPKKKIMELEKLNGYYKFIFTQFFYFLLILKNKVGFIGFSAVELFILDTIGIWLKGAVFFKILSKFNYN